MWKQFPTSYAGSFENNMKPTMEQLWDNLTKTLGHFLGSDGDFKVNIGQLLTIFMRLAGCVLSNKLNENLNDSVQMTWLWKIIDRI